MAAVFGVGAQGLSPQMISMLGLGSLHDEPPLGGEVLVMAIGEEFGLLQAQGVVTLFTSTGANGPLGEDLFPFVGEFGSFAQSAR